MSLIGISMVVFGIISLKTDGVFAAVVFILVCGKYAEEKGRQELAALQEIYESNSQV